MALESPPSGAVFIIVNNEEMTSGLKRKAESSTEATTSNGKVLNDPIKTQKLSGWIKSSCFHSLFKEALIKLSDEIDMRNGKGDACPVQTI